MKMPANEIPIAIRTPSCVNPAEPLSINARKPTAVVSAPKKMARPRLAIASPTARGMIGAFIARLLVTAENQNREIDSEPDQNRAESDRHHVEPVENQEADRERDQAAKQERNPHADQRQPAMEADIENSADQQDRAEQRDDDVVSHAQRNFRDVGRSARHQNLQRPAIPAFVRLCAERFHLPHQFLAIERADAR